MYLHFCKSLESKIWTHFPVLNTVPHGLSFQPVYQSTHPESQFSFLLTSGTAESRIWEVTLFSSPAACMCVNEWSPHASLWEPWLITHCVKHLDQSHFTAQAKTSRCHFSRSEKAKECVCQDKQHSNTGQKVCVTQNCRAKLIFYSIKYIDSDSTISLKHTHFYFLYLQLGL